MKYKFLRVLSLSVLICTLFSDPVLFAQERLGEKFGVSKEKEDHLTKVLNDKHNDNSGKSTRDGGSDGGDGGYTGGGGGGLGDALEGFAHSLTRGFSGYHSYGGYDSYKEMLGEKYERKIAVLKHKRFLITQGELKKSASKDLVEKFDRGISMLSNNNSNIPSGVNSGNDEVFNMAKTITDEFELNSETWKRELNDNLLKANSKISEIAKLKQNLEKEIAIIQFKKGLLLPIRYRDDGHVSKDDLKTKYNVDDQTINREIDAVANIVLGYQPDRYYDFMKENQPDKQSLSDKVVGEVVKIVNGMDKIEGMSTSDAGGVWSNTKVGSYYDKLKIDQQKMVEEQKKLESEILSESNNVKIKQSEYNLKKAMYDRVKEVEERFKNASNTLLNRNFKSKALNQAIYGPF